MKNSKPKIKALHVKSMDNINLRMRSDIANTEQTF